MRGRERAREGGREGGRERESEIQSLPSHLILRIFHVIHVDIVSVPFDFWGSYVRESNRHVKAMVTKVAPQEIPSPFRECWWPHGAVSKIGWIMMDLGSMVLATKAAMTTPNYDPWQVRFPGGFAPGQAPEAQSEAHGGFWSKTQLLSIR